MYLIDRKAEELRKLNAAVENIENLIDAAAAILEDARRRQSALRQEIEREILEDAVEFPSVIYA